MIYEFGAEDDLRSGWAENLTEGARLLLVRARFLGSERTAAETPPRMRVTRRPPPSGSGTRARRERNVTRVNVDWVRAARSFSN